MDEVMNLLILHEIAKIPTRVLRDRSNPLEHYNDNDFLARFRFSKNVVIHIIHPLVEDDLKPRSNRGCPVSGMLQLLISLRFYGSGSYQAIYGELYRTEQSFVSVTIKKVSAALVKHFATFIAFPENLRLVQREFLKIKQFPGVIGCVDGTHIPIQNPKRDTGEVYRNRKGYFSLNVQVVCGPKQQIFDMVCRWPGSAHDSRIFDNSGIKLRLEEGYLRGIVLGDSGYAQRRYLFTPISNPGTPEENRYNVAHIATRNTVERTFGVWKRRFPCLRNKLATKMNTTTNIISACAILHNIGLLYNRWEDDELDQIDDVQEAYVGNEAQGNLIRQAFINRYFTRG